MKTVETERWKESFPEFKEKTEAFFAGNLDKKDYKGFSGKYGSYAQRDGKALMLRLRMTGGRLTKEKLKFVAEVIEEFQVNLVHMTTCQTIQLHNLQADTACKIMERALDYGIVTMGGGGDFPRNVMVSPLTGTEEEYFDVMPYAQAAADYLLHFIHRKKLPRKLKVVFSNSPANISHATFRDLGFAARPDGRFDVYCAGGLGPNPQLGLKVGEAVKPEDVLYYIAAMWETFSTYGNYENRAKARTRYMRQSLGDEGLKAAFLEKLEMVRASGEDLTIVTEKKEKVKTGDGSFAKGERIRPQKQEGLYSVHYHPLGGVIKPSKFREIYDLIREMEDVELRLAPDESLYVINLTGNEAEAVEKITGDGANTPLEASVACIGASICQAGVRDSQKLLTSITETVSASGLPGKALPRLHISGCPSSCGTHQIGVIGFRGGVKLIDKVAHPAFTLYVHGCDIQGREAMGEEVGVILEKDIPRFLVELGKTVEASGKDFEAWFAQNPEGVKKAAQNYLQ